MSEEKDNGANLPPFNPATPKGSGGIVVTNIDKCRWTQDAQHIDWNACATSCEKLHYFPDGTIKDNEYEYCPYCGKEIEEVK